MPIKKILTPALLTLVITGCSSAGMVTAPHNGKLYYTPENCSRFTYYYDNPDKIFCLDKEVQTGVYLYPADSQQVENYRAQEAADEQTRAEGREAARAFKEAAEAYRDSMPKTTRTKCRDSYDGIDCTSTTY